ncbi:hypothetical protein B9T34_18000 [Acinetobacter sp. ANC 3813]|nr:hypothetical protein B9T34_18000 [Acinetobacter sp. ANC 3813]
MMQPIQSQQVIFLTFWDPQQIFYKLIDELASAVPTLKKCFETLLFKGQTRPKNQFNLMFLITLLCFYFFYSIVNAALSNEFQSQHLTKCV